MSIDLLCNHHHFCVTVAVTRDPLASTRFLSQEEEEEDWKQKGKTIKSKRCRRERQENAREPNDGQETISKEEQYLHSQATRMTSTASSCCGGGLAVVFAFCSRVQHHQQLFVQAPACQAL